MEIAGKLEKLAESREAVAFAGTGAVLLLAGVTKFTMPELWTGYEPAFLLELFSADRLLQASAVLETGLGLWLLAGRRRTFAAAAATLWLGSITVYMAQLGFWALAIRDFGLTVLALVALLSALDRHTSISS